MKFNLITVTRNSYKIIDLLLSIELELSISNLNKYLIIDNNSSEDFISNLLSIITVLSWRDKIELVRNDKNWLFSHSNNIGIKKSKDVDFTFLINPDIELKSQDPFDKIITYMNDYNAGIAGALLVYPNGLVEHAGGIENTHIGYKNDPQLYINSSVVEWVTGALFCISKETIDKIGLLDEKTFPHWVSDQEYCRRASLIGISTLFVPVTFTHHQGDGTKENGHKECHNDLPEGVLPNDIPVSVEYIKEISLKNSKLIPLLF